MWVSIRSAGIKSRADLPPAPSNKLLGGESYTLPYYSGESTKSCFELQWLLGLEWVEIRNPGDPASCIFQRSAFKVQPLSPFREATTECIFLQGQKGDPEQVPHKLKGLLYSKGWQQEVWGAEAHWSRKVSTVPSCSGPAVPNNTKQGELKQWTTTGTASNPDVPTYHKHAQGQQDGWVRKVCVTEVQAGFALPQKPLKRGGKQHHLAVLWSLHVYCAHAPPSHTIIINNT